MLARRVWVLFLGPNPAHLDPEYKVPKEKEDIQPIQKPN
jgi:hypothetical protein